MDEVERLRRQAEIRKRRLLERSSARMKLIYPNYEESSNCESNESALDDGYGGLMKSESVAKGDHFDHEDVGPDEGYQFSASRVSTSSTFPAYFREGASEETTKRGPSPGPRTPPYIEYWNRRELGRLRRVGSCVLGILLFVAHHFVPDSFSSRVSSVSGIALFSICQLLAIQASFYGYSRSFLRFAGPRDCGNRTWSSLILGCASTRELDSFALLSILVQYGVAVKNVISEWLHLVTFYFITSLLSGTALTN
ncbi:transmembrane domain-containing protein [Cryptosporidium canis]|uniref:Transmembrane domain-containing protein n=1 Tax=Cryptosporidium canis TaxID=195482 RepID=A0ABQ8P865_9CRYT|nr:transmembrane domain-containing protein [Cryptosporidium canis]KAJ1608797.1 transmembrane domain-containing protein [Cryptosporidium canis]